MDLKTLDKRLQRLLLRDRRIAPEDLDRATRQLEDLSDRVQPPSEEELNTLASSVVAEKAVREERIRLAVQRYREQAEFLPEIEPKLEEEIDDSSKPEP
jgi:hypothetical protein